MSMKFQDGKESEFNKGKAKNTHFYGAEVYRFAEAWANAMERAMAAGSTIGDCARAAEREADTEGLSGFQYGCAVSLLAACWVHGEELRRWHNPTPGVPLADRLLTHGLLGKRIEPGRPRPYPVEFRVKLSVATAALIDKAASEAKLPVEDALRAIIEAALANEPPLSADEQGAFWLRYKIER